MRTDSSNDILSLKNYKNDISKYLELLQRGNYYQQLIPYINIFDLENIKIVLKDEINLNPKKVVSEIYSFLEVDSQFVPSIVEKKISPGIIPRIKILENIRNLIHSWTRNNVPWFIELIKKYGIAELYRKINNKREFRVDRKVKKVLYNYYEIDVKKTGQLINKDLSIWKMRY